MCGQACGSGQEAAGESEDSGLATRGIHLVYVYFYILHSQTFTLICQRGEQDEAAGATHVSAECFCLCWPVGPSMYIRVHTCCMPVFVQKLSGSQRTALLQAGPRPVELRQPHLCQVPRFSNSLASKNRS